jgi:hypothetical protein
MPYLASLTDWERPFFPQLAASNPAPKPRFFELVRASPILNRVSLGMAVESNVFAARGRFRSREAMAARSVPPRARLASWPHGSRVRSISRASEDGLQELKVGWHSQRHRDLPFVHLVLNSGKTIIANHQTSDTNLSQAY